LQLLEALARQFQITIGRLLSLLDERVQHRDTLAHHEAVERAAYASPTTWPQLEQSVAKGAGVRQAKTGAVLGQKLNEARIVCKDINWPGFDLGEHAFMEVLDLKRDE
jgi:hypothetical protein